MYNIPAGAYVYEVTDGGAADEAGIQQGDIITKLDKTTISSMSELLDRIQYYEAGETVEVTVKRSGDNGYEEQVIEVTLQAKTDTTGSDTSSDVTDQNEDSQDQQEDFQDVPSDGGQDNLQNGNGNGRRPTAFGYFF